MTNLSSFSAALIDGTQQPLSAYAGKVVLIVNVASKCGLTPQYEGLEALWRSYGDQGLVVLGFPCNQFSGQEPGSNAEIASFCSLTYDVTFPMFSKIDVNGEHAPLLYAWLKAQSGNIEPIEWNFGKFLIARDGTSVTRFAPDALPESLAPTIETLL